MSIPSVSFNGGQTVRPGAYTQMDTVQMSGNPVNDLPVQVSIPTAQTFNLEDVLGKFVITDINASVE